MVSRARRVMRHLFFSRRRLRRCFPAATLARIEQEIRDSERTHRAEVRFAVEAGLDVIPVWQGLTPRERAIMLFSELRVWDTEENNGVLLYVQLADRDIEIVADRGLGRVVPQHEWEAVCHRMEDAFRAGRYEEGALEAIRSVTAVLQRHCPPSAGDKNELPNRPVVL